MRKIKIVASLGPATNQISVIEKLLKAGMNIARINASHGDHAQWLDLVQKLKIASKNTNIACQLMVDLQGPKIRLGVLKNPLQIQKNDIIIFDIKRKIQKTHIPLPYSPLLNFSKLGQKLLIEDGKLQTEIIELDKINKIIKVKALNHWTLQSNKGVNCPDLKMPASNKLNKKDKIDLVFAIKTLKADVIALSFVDCGKDIASLRRNILKLTKKNIKIVAKIERQSALDNLEEIIKQADVLMVARGDLGIETPIERVPIEQKLILAQAHHFKKPVIVATQILESMVHNLTPTRAEVSDAAQAVFDHADAFMLSNETAVGEYPIESVQTLAKIADATESALHLENLDYLW